jgi:hypothetical protein
MRRKRVLLSIFVLAFISEAAWGFTHEIAEAELQQKVVAAMPVEIRKPAYVLTISDPVVDLAGNNEIVGVVAQVVLEIPEQTKAVGTVTLSGKLAYEPQSYAIYFRNVLIRKLEVEGVQDAFLPAVRLVAQFAVARAFAARPIYVIKDDSLKAKFARAFLKSISVQDHKLVLTMEIF